MVRTKTKTEVASIKLTPECRRAWEAAATSERRSLEANRAEVALPRNSVIVVIPTKWTIIRQQSAGKAIQAIGPQDHG